MNRTIREPKLKPVPSREEMANSASLLDEVARTLGITEAKARPRRWTMRIGQLLQEVRNRLDHRQDDTAKKAGITQSYLSRLENGVIQRRGPTVDLLLRWAEASNADLEFAVRAKDDGRLLGMVSSKDLSRHASGVDKPKENDAEQLTEFKVTFAYEDRPAHSRGHALRTEIADQVKMLRGAQEALKDLTSMVELASASRTFKSNPKVGERAFETITKVLPLLLPAESNDKMSQKAAIKVDDGRIRCKVRLIELVNEWQLESEVDFEEMAARDERKA
jgi:transcriptional regulator with XRE-family HTH domain